MLELSRSHLILLVSALNDAIKYNQGFLKSETIKGVSDYEDHLLCLENLQNWLEDEDKALEKNIRIYWSTTRQLGKSNRSKQAVISILRD